MAVGIHCEVVAGEGCDQHDEAGFWQVEVSEHGSGGLELVAGGDEDVGVAHAGFY